MIYLALILGLFLQSTFLSIPILIPIILSYFVFSKNSNAFGAAFIFGIFLDIFLLNPIGLTSIYMCAALFMVFLYSRKFEIQTLPFLSIFTFISVSFYDLFFSVNFLILKSVLCTAIAIAIYYAVIYFRNKNKTVRSLVK